MKTSMRYQICIKEQLSEQWAEWFDPFIIQPQPEGQTWLVGPVRDQSELHGLLLKIRDLNLTLIAVKLAEPTSESA